MNYIDIILFILFLWAAFRGFTRGFIIALASLVALIGGIYLAIHYSYFIGDLYKRWFTTDNKYLPFISFSLTFLMTIGLVYLIAFLLETIVKATGLGIINRLLGVIFNVLKLALIISVIMNLFNFVGDIKPIIPEKQKQESLLYGTVSKIAPSIFPYLKFDNWRKPFKKV